LFYNYLPNDDEVGEGCTNIETQEIVNKINRVKPSARYDQLMYFINKGIG